MKNEEGNWQKHMEEFQSMLHAQKYLIKIRQKIVEEKSSIKAEEAL